MKFLVAYDGSASAQRALGRAIELSGPDDDIHVVGVTALSRPTRRANGPVDRDVPTGMERALEHARQRVAEGRASWRVTMRRGDPEAVLSAEVQAGYDLVFVGSRPLSGLERMLLGSVTSWIAHHAACDVVITR
jgi:nucleotide-binding universal stress UspA family protein